MHRAFGVVFASLVPRPSRVRSFARARVAVCRRRHRRRHRRRRRRCYGFFYASAAVFAASRDAHATRVAVRARRDARDADGDDARERRERRGARAADDDDDDDGGGDAMGTDGREPATGARGDGARARWGRERRACARGAGSGCSARTRTRRGTT
jgi:hypothetical protein